MARNNNKTNIDVSTLSKKLKETMLKKNCASAEISIHNNELFSDEQEDG